MDCPQCEAEVSSDNAFCGKCGYAMRDHGPQRTDQSRIRVHEEPTPTHERERDSRPSSPRIRKHTVLGMPPVPLRSSEPPPASELPPPPPASLASARSAKRTKQKTMLGMPRLESPEQSYSDPELELELEAESAIPGGAATGPPPVPGQDPPSHRARARVRYDSSLEPPPVTMRRRRAFGGVAVLVALAAAWLIYRFLNG